MADAKDFTERVQGESPWETRFGYRRAVRIGPMIAVSGTTAVGSDGRVRCPGDPAGQAKVAFETGLSALARLGVGVDRVIRTRMYVTDMAHSSAIGEVHGELFGEHPPAATMVEVSALIDPAMLVEIELEAYAPER